MKYRKIFGLKAGRGSTRSAFYAGEDHFLLVHNSYFNEEYRRFFYSEIEGILVRTTTGRRNALIVSSIILGILVLIAIASRTAETWITTAIIGFVPFPIVVANLILGPTVECKIRTTASEEIIGPIKRLRSYRKFLDRVAPIIEEHQGGHLEPEHLYARFRTSDTVRQGGL